MSGDTDKGLFRAVFGGEEGTVASAFEYLATNASIDHFQLQGQTLSQTRFDLPGDEAEGYWRFISFGPDVYVVLTDCRYRTARRETVIGEDLVEFHYILEGPVEITMPIDEAEDRRPSEVTMFVCHQTPGVTYTVACPPGSFRMVSLYVRPAVLLQSSSSGDIEGSSAYELLNPSPGTVVVIEQTITLELITVLRELFSINFDARYAMPLVAGKILELLARTVATLDQRSHEDEESMVLTAREIQMFEQARDILGSEFSSVLTIPSLARKLGTNSTKLKSGFKFLYGMTIFSYRNERRMERAMELLIEDKHLISTVAESVGFKHQASFSSAFRSYFGFSPKHARQMKYGEKV